MNIESDEHIKRFQAESDRAFLAMQTSADQEMEKFMKSYAQEGYQLASFRTPEISWNGIPPILLSTKALTAGAGTAKKRVKQAAEKLDKMTGGKASKAAGALQDNLHAHAQDTRNDITTLLRGSSMDLGERAKREATAMREAARKAMSEEKSLSGLAERAKQELAAAKQRIQAELLDAGNDAVEAFEGVAVDKFSELGEEALDASEQVEERLRRGENPFDPPQKLR